jgi:hypothetical protein
MVERAAVFPSRVSRFYFLEACGTTEVVPFPVVAPPSS